jgi:hypothetical protein
MWMENIGNRGEGVVIFQSGGVIGRRSCGSIWVTPTYVSGPDGEKQTQRGGTGRVGGR